MPTRRAAWCADAGADVVETTERTIVSQAKSGDAAAKEQSLRGLFDAYKRRDRAALEQLLADDFRFTSPYDHNIDRATYFERCWPTSVLIREQVIERVVVAGDEAFVTYRASMQEGVKFRNTEFFTFHGDRIKSVDVYFGATFKDGVFVPQKTE